MGIVSHSIQKLLACPIVRQIYSPYVPDPGQNESREEPLKNNVFFLADTSSFN